MTKGGWETVLIAALVLPVALVLTCAAHLLRAAAGSDYVATVSLGDSGKADGVVAMAIIAVSIVVPMISAFVAGYALQRMRAAGKEAGPR